MFPGADKHKVRGLAKMACKKKKSSKKSSKGSKNVVRSLVNLEVIVKSPVNTRLFLIYVKNYDFFT